MTESVPVEVVWLVKCYLVFKPGGCSDVDQAGGGEAAQGAHQGPGQSGPAVSHAGGELAGSWLEPRTALSSVLPAHLTRSRTPHWSRQMSPVAKSLRAPVNNWH